MKRLPLYAFFLLFCMIFVTACSVKKPDDVISKSKMENILYEFHLAKAMQDEGSRSENDKEILYEKYIFNKYGVTKAQFDSSMVWYTRNTEVLVKIYNVVAERMKSEDEYYNKLVALHEGKPKTSTRGDSIDVWGWRKLVKLTGNPINDVYTFSLPGDSNFHDRDTLIWNVDYHKSGNIPAGHELAVMAMQIRYSSDTIINRTIKITKPGPHYIALHADTLGKISAVNGFIYFTGGVHASHILLADHITMMRYHCKDTLSFTARESLRKAAIRDSLNTLKKKRLDDSIKRVNIIKAANPHAPDLRLSPHEVGRIQKGSLMPKRPEQEEVEERIRREKQERLQLQRQNYIRNNQMKTKKRPVPVRNTNK